ncbi:TorF family putative porin [Colwellia hornerae]|uniref:Porin n=1 Tax=Colwellia hornerae TaxID=89402 RepID=A0A5C6Q8B1_9GAMM|nr:TorF family putative porin [Colwellia hornerae]TWX57749.1 hypothetical protein ESZ28_03300 [Colwellia hornerae]TWX62520.1 hypothetical protein ESZ26_01385 [Colwellia hornerae]TWX65079.1 hypothetical protein ESZ27_13250 [Colwellia hornerae]
MKKRLLLVTTLLTISTSAFADLSSTVTLASDYLFNGVSQTDESPALQGSLDWSDASGWYAGAWASNVDFGDDTSFEVDVYLGYSMAINEEITLDAGVAQYTYNGASYSSDGNYSEIYTKWNFGATDLNIWYAWDYFGTGAGHYIVMLNHTFTINDDLTLLVGIDRSSSLDDNKWQWEPGTDSYTHWQVTSNFSTKGFDFSLGLHGTDLDTYGDTTLLLTVARTFQF